MISVKSNNIFKYRYARIIPITQSTVNFMRLRNNERKSKIPIEPPGIYKKGRMLVPLDTPYEVQGGNDLLNISICIQGKNYNHPEFAIDQLTKAVVLANRYLAMFRARIRNPREFVDGDLSAHLTDTIVSFSRSADANNYQISEDLLSEDIKLKELGSF